MSEIQLDIPNIVVLVNTDPDYRKVIVKPDSNFNVNINVPRLVSRVSGSFIQFAETSLTSSYALTANRLIDSGTLQLGYITASSALISQSLYVGGLIYGTASQAITASYALNAAGSGFPFSGSAVITGSLLVIPTGGVGGITSSLLGTASIAENITVIFAGTYETGSDSPIVPTPSGGLIYVTSASYADSVKYTNVTGKPTLVSSSVQIDYNLIQNKPTNISSASYALTASYALNAGGGTGVGFPFSGSAVITGSLLVSSSGLTLIGQGLTGSVFGTSSYSFVSSQSLFAATASYISGGISIRQGLNVTGSVNISGSLNVFTGITGSLFGTASQTITASYALNSLSSSFASSAITASAATSITFIPSTASFATTASFALNAGGGSGVGFPFSGSAVITGSLLISGSGLRVTGSTDIVGALTATTKSFLIDHKKLPGKKLVYGVLEGAEHAVYARGKLRGSNIIKLPEEWEWLVDSDTITVQLTPIGSHQKLYVKSIDGLYITVEAGGFITQEINCYYLVHATRKDVNPLQTVV